MKNSTHIIQIANLIFERLKDEGYLDNCTTCVHWQETKEICEKVNRRPPAKIIVTGCELHEIMPF